MAGGMPQQDQERENTNNAASAISERVTQDIQVLFFRADDYKLV